MESHLLQMRGLKQRKSSCQNGRREVASFTDAWIETAVCINNSVTYNSRIFYRCVD